MASIWQRFVHFIQGSDGKDLDFYEDTTAQNVPSQPVSGSPLHQPDLSNQAKNIRILPADPELTRTTTAFEEPDRFSTHEEDTPDESPLLSDTQLKAPYWLEDEDTLKDEGVLFGLSESEPTEKTDIIRSYFSHLASSHEHNIEHQNERIQELNLFIGQKENRIDELVTKLKGLENTPHDGEHQLPRTLVGLALSIAMCVGNYYLIKDTLSSSFASSSYVALGVFLAGMFNLFGRISLFHDTDSNVSWRRLLEEVGMPFAAALFVFAQAWQTQPWWQATALFVFVLFLFLFAGKLFLSNITVLRNDLRVWLTSRRSRREALDYSLSWEEEIVKLTKETDELRVQKWQVLREQNISESERDRLYARRDMLISIFISEFSLARSHKAKLSDRQLREIRGD